MKYLDIHLSNNKNNTLQNIFIPSFQSLDILIDRKLSIFGQVRTYQYAYTYDVIYHNVE